MYTCPPSVTKAEWRAPALTWTTTVCSSDASIRGVSSDSRAPVPRRPVEPRPHANATPVDVRKSVCAAPQLATRTRCGTSSITFRGAPRRSARRGRAGRGRRRQRWRRRRWRTRARRGRRPPRRGDRAVGRPCGVAPAAGELVQLLRRVDARDAVGGAAEAEAAARREAAAERAAVAQEERDRSPHATCAAAYLIVSTRRGATSSTSAPWPSAPYTPRPHVHNPPSLSRKPVCSRPQLTCEMCTAPSAATRMNSGFASSVPWPSLPCAPSPHVATCPPPSTSAVCRAPHDAITTCSSSSPVSSFASFSWSASPGARPER